MTRNAALSLAGQMCAAAVTTGLTIYLARALGPEEFGVFSVALGIAATLFLFADLGISTSAARYVAERRDDPAAVAEVMASALRLKLTTGGIVCLGLFLAAGPIGAALGEPKLDWALRGMALALLGQNLMALYGAAFVALGRVSKDLQIVVAKSVVELVATVLAVMISAGAAEAAFGRAIGFVMGGTAGLLLAVRFLGPEAMSLRRAPNSPIAGQVARYAGVLFVIDGSFALFAQIDVILIAGLLSATAAGLFQAPLRLITFLGYPALALAAGVTPRLAGEVEGRRTDAFSAALRYAVLLQGAVLAPLIVWATPIVDLILGDGYEGSAAALRGLGPYAFILGVGTLVSVAVNYLGEARRRVPVALGALAVNIVIDVILIPEIGIVAGAIGTGVGFLIYTAGHLWILVDLIDLPLRPLVVTFGRTMLGVVAMAGVLLAFGTGELSLPAILVGATTSLLLYLVVLVATREVPLAELRALRARVSR